MLPTTCTVIRLKSPPINAVKLTDFAIKTEALRELRRNELLLKALYISVDPGMRGGLYSQKANTILYSPQICQVISSKSSKFNIGDIVTGNLSKGLQTTCPWATYCIKSDKYCRKISNKKLIPYNYYLGPLGGTGLTAYMGLLNVAKIKQTDNVFISGAAGAVGSVAGQIAKHVVKCSRVIGTAGSNKKCEWIVNELGYDNAINYKLFNNNISLFRKELASKFPNGIDVYFDNTGGFITHSIWNLLNVGARVVISGQIANYNRLRNPPKVDEYLHKLIYKQIRIEGFVIYGFKQFDKFESDMCQWIKDGKIKSKQTVMHGIENVPKAFIGLFKGANTGKMVVKIHDLKSKL
eukprot:53756_1